MVNYNLRSQPDLFSLSGKTSHNGLNYLRYVVDNVWYNVPEEIKNKRKLRDRKPKNSHCKLCRIYLHNLGYID